MKKTYEQMKAAGEKMRIADWFDLSEKVPSWPWRASYPQENFTIVNETEKAVQVEWEAVSCDGEYERAWKAWLPKAALESYEDHAERQQSAFEAGCKRYDAAIAFAKEHGVKGVRVGLRLVTILDKIQKAGLVFAC